MDGLHRRIYKGARRRASETVAVTVVAAVALVAAACGSSASSTPSAAKAKRLVPVTFENNFAASGDDSYYVYAKQLGYYAKQGIDLTIGYGTGSGTVAEEIGAGTVDIGDPFSVSALAAIGKGEPLEIVGNQQAEDEFGVFVPQASGITSFGGLAGKTLLCAPGTAEIALLPSVLQKAGLSESAVKVEGVSPAVLLTEYEHGAADAACYNVDPGFTKVVDAIRPSTPLFFASQGVTAPTTDLVVNKTFFKEHPALVRGFLKATYEGIVATLKHPAAAVAAMAATVPTIPEQTLSEQLIGMLPSLCSSAMISANEPLGYNNMSNWQSALSVAQSAEGAPATLKLSGAVTNQFFTGSHPVSTTSCKTVESLAKKASS